MSSLVSAGVSVPVINDSFYIPASAPTVPLFFIATRANKKQPDALTPALGTQEHDVVRTVTSIGQSAQLYGVPSFLKDSSGNQFHGDARNEYGVLALNQFLGVGNRAYVVRANVDLADAPKDFIAIGTPELVGDVSLVGVGNGTLVDGENGLTILVPSVFVEPQKINIVFNTATTYTVIGSVDGILGFGLVGEEFDSSTVSFTVFAGDTPFAHGDYFEFNIGYTATGGENTGDGQLLNLLPNPLLPAISSSAEDWTVTITRDSDSALIETFTVTGSVSGLSVVTGTTGVAYDNGKVMFTIAKGQSRFQTGDTFTFSTELVHRFDPLGATQEDKRAKIVQSLQAMINSNSEVRATETYEYNLIVAPGYPEVIDELLALNVAIEEEAFVIGDTPVDNTPEQTATWAMSSDRFNSNNLAYYYPWGLASNLDGTNVVCAPSGIALRTFAYSDNQSYVWFAPAGARRGLVTGVAKVGYVTGNLGQETTFVEVNLNQGQRDNLYEFNKNINPIVFFAGRGLLVWGQKTSPTAASALDRVNAVRLVCYLKRALRKGAFPFVFEPNDKTTRDNLKAAADGILNDIMAKRGLYDFATLSDDSNNTPERIDNNELYLDVAIKPVKAAEFIYIPIRVLSTGAPMPS